MNEWMRIKHYERVRVCMKITPTIENFGQISEIKNLKVIN
jgi:hypothetical protein